MIKVMIVDDSAVVRESMKEILSSDKEIEVVATAADPLIALSKLKTIKPDVITLDIEMPRMDGLTFLEQLMKENPLPIIICSSMVESGGENAIRAMDLGAIEMILKPKMGARQFIEESKTRICDAVHAAFLAKPHIIAGKKPIKKRTTSLSRTIASLATPKLTADVMLKKGSATVIETTEKIIVIGASTGGTEALKDFLEVLPPNAPGIVIVQHMPEKFTKSFSQRLNSLSQVEVREAKDGDSVIRGQVLIAPGNKHTLVKRAGARYYVEVKDGPLVSRHRPSVDILFRSAARYAGKNAIGIIMTGMGDDGSRGMKEMHERGSYTIAQDEKSCVVYGMPAEAVKKGAVDRILPLDDIAKDALEHAQ